MKALLRRRSDAALIAHRNSALTAAKTAQLLCCGRSSTTVRTWHRVGTRPRATGLTGATAAILAAVEQRELVRWEVQTLERQRRGIDERIAVALP
jgi:hypothetical protein